MMHNVFIFSQICAIVANYPYLYSIKCALLIKLILHREQNDMPRGIYGVGKMREALILFPAIEDTDEHTPLVCYAKLLFLLLF